MLKEYPIYFDDVKLFVPSKWEESSSVVESVNQTEAGTDQVIVIRSDKLSVSASFQCSGSWVARFAEFRDKDSITVKLYDVKTQGYKTRQMRMRNFQPGLEEHSENTRGTNGLYTVSFDLEEF